MTRARALKQVIRARAAKTGERYTTARRHVLKDLQQTTVPAARLRSTTAPRAAAAGSSKGSVSDAKSLEKTGHGLDHWFDVLDRFGAVDKGHTAAARHLYDVHHVDGWYAQGITVAYERARGVRALNQRCDGGYQVSVSKVVAAETTDVIKAFTERAGGGGGRKASMGAWRTRFRQRSIARRPRDSSSGRMARDAFVISGTTRRSSSICCQNLEARCQSS